MAPVRELVSQISEECSKMAYYVKGLSTCTIIGGTSIEKQGYELQSGKQIVVATPGRLIDLIKSRYLVLRQCKYLILDEADRMITMGFEENVETVLRAMRGEALDIDDDGQVILMKKEESSATLRDEDRPTIHMFSATMPASVSNLAKTYLHQPVYVQIGDVDSMKNRNINQQIMLIGQKRKLPMIQDILRQN
jgi:ATP-dependent RNA helicase DDX23/PRP28